MLFSEVDRLLDPAPMALETGFERLPSGVIHVACRTDMHGVQGKHFEWWFRSRPSTREYIWWHPVDHVFSAWEGGDTSTHVGSTHKVTEALSGLPPMNLKIQLRDSLEFFDEKKYIDARRNGFVSAAICGRTSENWDPHLTPDGKILGGRMLHIGRDTEWGMALRSHFFLGEDFPAAGMSPEHITEMLPDAIAPALLQHCYDEFTYLSRFLPSLYIGEHRDIETPRNPW